MVAFDTVLGQRAYRKELFQRVDAVGEAREVDDPGGARAGAAWARWCRCIRRAPGGRRAARGLRTWAADRVSTGQGAWSLGLGGEGLFQRVHAFKTVSRAARSSGHDRVFLWLVRARERRSLRVFRREGD